VETRVIKLDAERPDTGNIKEAAELLEAGGLVAFPTETVYGIGCRACVKSLERLDQAKQRTWEKRYAVHLARRDDVHEYVPQVGLRAAKLIRTGWPGPLTIVFELSNQQLQQQRKKLGNDDMFRAVYRDNSIGLRCPDNTVAAALLQQCRSPIVAPSANVSGQPAATCAEEVLLQLAGRIELLLDGGPCRHKKSSTVVRLGENGLRLLRKGVYSLRDVQRMWRVNILFVCTGNTCRSPMAEGLCRKYLAEKLGCEVDGLEEMGYKIVSAGVMAAAGLRPSREAVAICEKAGVDIAGCISQRLSARLVQQSDHIFVMCQTHLREIVSRWPEATAKCQLLAPDMAIDDPIGQGQEVYERIGGLIRGALKKRISELVL
jgi:protein-tyrosine phosphatase